MEAGGGAGCGLLRKHQTHTFQMLSGPKNALKTLPKLGLMLFQGKKKINSQVPKAPRCASSGKANSESAPRGCRYLGCTWGGVRSWWKQPIHSGGSHRRWAARLAETHTDGGFLEHGVAEAAGGSSTRAGHPSTSSALGPRRAGGRGGGALAGGAVAAPLCPDPQRAGPDSGTAGADRP